MTVIPPLPVNTRLHGFVVPMHVDELTFEGALQPANDEPLAAVALSVIVAALSEVVMFGAHVPETVCEEAADPVPPQPDGAFTVPLLGVMVTDPPPVPAKGMIPVPR